MDACSYESHEYLLTPAIGWLGKELQALRNFSIGHLNDRGHLDGNSPVLQALSDLDGALTDMGTVHDAVGNERFKPLLTKEEAKQAIQGTSHAEAVPPLPSGIKSSLRPTN